MLRLVEPSEWTAYLYVLLDAQGSAGLATLYATLVSPRPFIRGNLNLLFLCLQKDW